MTVTDIATVLAWCDALRERNIGTLESLSTDDIALADADGASQGHLALADWAGAVPAPAEVGRVYVRDGVVVLEHLDAARGATAFRVVGEQVASVFRHDNLGAALTATDLGEADLHSD